MESLEMHIQSKLKRKLYGQRFYKPMETFLNNQKFKNR
jgi:hypothetical protein